MAKVADYYLWNNQIGQRQKNIIIKVIHKNNGRLSIRLTYQDYDNTDGEGVLKIMNEHNVGTVADVTEMKTKLMEMMEPIIVENLKNVPESVGDSYIKRGLACINKNDKSKYQTIDLTYITASF